MSTKYTAHLNGQLVGKRTSASNRVYTHAVIVDQPFDRIRTSGPGILAWCGRADLAAKQASKASKYFAFVTVVEVKLVPTKAKKAVLNVAGFNAGYKPAIAEIDAHIAAVRGGAK